MAHLMGSESPLNERLGQLGSCSPGSRSSLLSSGLFFSILCPILSQVPRRGRALPIYSDAPEHEDDGSDEGEDQGVGEVSVERQLDDVSTKAYGPARRKPSHRLN